MFGQGQALLAKGTNGLMFALPLFPMLMLSSGVAALHQLVPKSVLQCKKNWACLGSKRQELQRVQLSFGQRVTKAAQMFKPVPK